MFIKYNETNIHAIPHIKTKQVRLKNRKTGKVRIEDRIDGAQSPQDIKWLRPGWNEFPREVWEQNKKSPVLMQMIKDKKIEVMNETVVVTEGKKKVKKVVGQDDEEVSLRLFSETRALEIVKDTLNRDMLQRWMDEETRHKVKRMLAKQIKPLLNNTKSDEE